MENKNEELIRKKDAIDAVQRVRELHAYDEIEEIKNLPTVQPTNEMLERCKFEYIHACKIASFPTPDVTGKDKQDAYAVIKALQPIFGDVTF